jgi:hypothetical protein
MSRFGVGDMQQSADKVVEVIQTQVCVLCREGGRDLECAATVELW